MLLDLSYQNKVQQRTLKRELKVLNAAQLHVHVTKDDVGFIAQAVNVSVERLIHWQTTATWQEAVDFWTGSGDYANPLPLKKRSNLSSRRKRAIKPALYDKQDGFCNGCERFVLEMNMTIDHIQPRSQGGGSRRENLQLLCESCNVLKSDGTQQELIEKLQADGRLHRRSGLSRFFARAFYASFFFLLSLIYVYQ